MRLLMFHCKEFWYTVGRPGLRNRECPVGEEKIYNNCAVIFIHVEPGDVERESRVIRKVINNVTWYARKTRVETIVLHSFAHLSEKKADPEVGEKLLNIIFEKLKRKINNVELTPFGCFLEFRMHVFATPISRVFKVL